MDVRTLSARLGVSARATSRAQELVRLAAAKLGTAGAVALVRPAVCLDLACAELRVPVDRESLMRACGGTAKVYLAQLSVLGNCLDLRPHCDARALGVRFGALRCAPAAEHCLALFKSRFVTSLGRKQSASADFSRPVFAAAAFALAARAAGIRVPRPQLCAAAGVAPAELTAMLTQMAHLCADLFKGAGLAEDEDAPNDAAAPSAPGNRSGAEAPAAPPRSSPRPSKARSTPTATAGGARVATPASARSKEAADAQTPGGGRKRKPEESKATPRGAAGSTPRRTSRRLE